MNFKRVIVSIISSFFIAIPAKGGENYIEFDPLDYIFEGASLVVKRSSTFNKNLTIGVGYFNIKLPDFENDKGVEGEVTNGFELHLDYHFTNPDKGSFTGLLLIPKEWKIQKNGMSTKYKTIGVIWRYGYIWRPWSSGFYINPWIGVIFEKKASGKNVVDGETYDIPEPPVIGLVYLGYSF